MRSCAFFILDAATISMALVILRVLCTLLILLRISLEPAIYPSTFVFSLLWSAAAHADLFVTMTHHQCCRVGRPSVARRQALRALASPASLTRTAPSRRSLFHSMKSNMLHSS